MVDLYLVKQCQQESGDKDSINTRRPLAEHFSFRSRNPPISGTLHFSRRRLLRTTVLSSTV